ncbi:hypothetical protein [Methylocystis bryophila]|nr:hypothetical protein [Methylocystis bryophila]BDV39275.1 hypothetical protein DSM21852_25280 [Methylocystis bryophila]
MTNGRRTLGLALCASLMLAGLAVPTVADPWNTQELRPLRATSFELGSQRVLAFFVPAEGQCKVTLMIADARDDAAPKPGSRLSLRIEPGRSATFDGRDGQSLRLACRAEASGLLTSRIKTLAASANDE